MEIQIGHLYIVYIGLLLKSDRFGMEIFIKNP